MSNHDIGTTSFREIPARTHRNWDHAGIVAARQRVYPAGSYTPDYHANPNNNPGTYEYANSSGNRRRKENGHVH
jgi:hypothetical protein